MAGRSVWPLYVEISNAGKATFWLCATSMVFLLYHLHYSCTMSVAAAITSRLALRSGDQMPMVGFGTCCRRSATGAQLIRSIHTYLTLGGRLIDTAQAYKNHKDIRIALRASLSIPRHDMWVTTKIMSIKQLERNGYNTTGYPTDSRAAATHAVRVSMSELGLDYIDLVLFHNPAGLDPDEQAKVWSGLIDAKLCNLSRNIGVSNFDLSGIRMLENATSFRPEAIQINFHPWVGPQILHLVAWCQAHGVVVTAYRSIKASFNLNANLSSLAALSQRFGASQAQILLKWAIDQRVAVIPGATSAKHIREILFMPTFHLDDTDLRLLQTS